MLKKILVLLFISFQLITSASQKIYLVHGFGSPKGWMHKINKTLKKDHFVTKNFAYHSMTDDLEWIGLDLYKDVKNCGFDTVSFVTHSMGALAVRSMLKYALNDSLFPVIYRIVMITPPNNGATVAEFYFNHKGILRILGPNIEHMRTDSNSYARKLPVPIESEVGIIIGIRKHGKHDKRFTGENDGVLTPEQTKLGIEKDTITVRNHHIRVPKTQFVRQQVIAFLRYGEFEKDQLILPVK
jgi:uncharacterized alpha/beta hydrolase family protein